MFPKDVVPVMALPTAPESLKATLPLPEVVTFAARILPPIVVAPANEALNPVIFNPPTVLIAAKATGEDAVELMIKESTPLALPRPEIAPVKVSVPDVPAFKVRLWAPPSVVVESAKLIFAPPSALDVVSKVTSAVKVTGALLIVIDPAYVVMLFPKLIAGVVPDPV